MPLSHCLPALIAGLFALLPATAMADGQRFPLNLPTGVSEISREVYDLHMLIFYICCVIGILVFGVLFYSLIAHRRSRRPQASKFSESLGAEIGWTLVPFVILVAMAVPAAKTLVAMEKPGDYDMTVKITGYQWKWHYEYLDQDLSFFSSLHPEHNEARQLGSGVDVRKIPNYLDEVDKPLVLPVAKRVRFLLTSNDVIHSWWLIDLAVKKDAVPGYINETWGIIEKPGTYYGKCAELCGRGHGFMPIKVVAVEDEEFNQWIDQQKSEIAAAAAGADRDWTFAELRERGRKVYVASCAACHNVDGSGLGDLFPAMTGNPVVNGPIESHIDIVLNGVAGTAMQAFRNQLNAVDLAAVITYERNDLGNEVGDSVQPREISKLLNN